MLAHRWIIPLSVFCLIEFVSQGWAADPSTEIEFTLTPNRIAIDPFYNGSEITVEAITPVGLDMVIVCKGREETLELKKKGKVWGFLWMNVGDLVFERFPSLYILLSSKKLSGIAPPEILDKYCLGYSAVSKYVTCNAPDDSDRSLFNEVIKLKERDRLFFIGEEKINVEPIQDNRQQIKGSFLLPPKASPFEYEVSLLGFREGQARIQSTKSIVLKRGAVITFITSAAKNHGLLYGCLAVFFAVCAGLCTGLIFGKKTHKS